MSDRDFEHQLRAELIRLGLTPLPAQPDPTRQARLEARAAAALEEILQSPTRPARLSRPRMALIAAAAVVALVLVGLPFLPRDHPAAVAATPPLLAYADGALSKGKLVGRPADPDLERLTAEAAAQPALPEEPVQKVLTTGWWSSTDEATGKARATTRLYPVDSAQYTLPDNTVLSTEVRGAALDKAGRTVSASSRRTTTVETFPGSELGTGYAAGLPTEPRALVRRLVDDPAECPVLGECLVGAITSLNQAWVVPPKVQAALWLTLLDRSEVTSLGDTRDRIGRPAVALLLTTPGSERQTILYADPATGLYRGYETVLIKDSIELGLTAPAVIDFTALVSATRVAASAVPRPVREPTRYPEPRPTTR